MNQSYADVGGAHVWALAPEPVTLYVRKQPPLLDRVVEFSDERNGFETGNVGHAKSFISKKFLYQEVTRLVLLGVLSNIFGNVF